MDTSDKLMETVLRESTCRICLCRISSPNLVNIFSKKSFSLNLSLLETFKEVAPTDVEIDENDLLPVNLCLKCAEKLKLVAAFKRRIKQSDSYLRLKLRSVKTLSSNRQLFTTINGNDEIIIIEESKVDTTKSVDNSKLNQIESSRLKPVNIYKEKHTAFRNGLNLHHSSESKPYFNVNNATLPKANNTNTVINKSKENVDFTLSVLNKTYNSTNENSSANNSVLKQNDRFLIKELLNSSVSDDIIITTNTNTEEYSRKHENVSGILKNLWKPTALENDDQVLQLQCSKCSQKFSSLAYLERHLEYHELNVIELQAKHGGQSFTKVPSTDQSVRNEELASSSSQNLQQKTSDNSVQTASHNSAQIIPHNSTPVSNSQLQLVGSSESTDCCRHCKLVLPSAQLRWHIYLKHNNEQIEQKAPVTVDLEECKYCSQKWASYNLRAHIRSCHREEQRREAKERRRTRFSCPICAKMFPALRSMQRHLHVHELKYHCTHCSEGFIKRTDLNIHLRKVHDVNLNPQSLCYMCGKMVSSSFMPYHYRTHVKRSIKCTVEGCDAVLKYKSSLKNHILCKHASEKQFICEHCGKSFALKATLRHHQIFHKELGQLRYGCVHCMKRYNYKRSLVAHLKVHRRKQMFYCPVCLMAFAYEPFMFRHISDCHPEDSSLEGYYPNITKTVSHLKNLRKCNYCEKYFCDYRILNRHVQKTHSELLQ